MNFRIILNLIRWDKPVGTLLLFLPCTFGVALNAKSLSDYYLIILFLIGSFIMRSSGCIINDIWDKDYDIKVERTKNRPIASKQISICASLTIFFTLCFFGLGILAFFSKKTILLSLLSIPLVIIYPFMKRLVFFPQIFLGITFNFGILIASMELAGSITIQSLILYLGSIFWTAGYDTIYGFMDIKDDKKIGIKSLSIFIENKSPKIWLLSFYSIFVSMTFFASYEGISYHHPASVISLFLLIFQFIWQVLTLDIDNSADCLYKFKSNTISGMLVFIFIASSQISRF